MRSEDISRLNASSIIVRCYTNQGLSKKEFALRSKISIRALNKILKTNLVPRVLVNRISLATGTTPGYWSYLHFQDNLKEVSQIEHKIYPIKSIQCKLFNKSPNSVGTMLKDLVQKSGRRLLWFDDLFKSADYSLHDIIYGAKRITPDMAARLSAYFKTETRYWLDIQSQLDIESMLSIRDPKLKKQMKLALDDFRVTEVSSSHHSVRQCPGEILLNRFIKPSGILVAQWRLIFGMSTKVFRNILQGRTAFTISFILKINRIFNTEIIFWMNLQNSFAANKADKKLKRLRDKITEVATSRAGSADIQSLNGNMVNPITLIVNQYLKPMNVSRLTFAKHIKVSLTRLEQIQRGKGTITPEIAVRIGQALDINPEFWLWMQFEYDLASKNKIPLV